METFQIITLISSILSLSTITGLIWKDLYGKEKARKEHVDQLEENETQEDLRTIIKEEILPMDKKVDSISKKITLLTEGTLSGLRNDILKCYYDCVRKGYRNDYDYTNMHDLFDAYKGLNGNSFVQDIIKRFDELPTKEEYRQAHKGGGALDGE